MGKTTGTGHDGVGTRLWRAAARHLIPNAGTLIAVLLVLSAYHVWAAPQAAVEAVGAITNATTGMLSYQGYLTDAGGNPITGSRNITFRLYSAPTGGTALWTEAYKDANAVPVDKGVFHVMLGSLTPIPTTVWANATIYLSVQVGTDAEMTPREIVGAVPLAMGVPDGSITTRKLNLDEDVDVQGRTLNNVNVVANSGNSIRPASGTTPAIRLQSANSVYVFIDRDNDQTDQGFGVYANNDAFVSPYIRLMVVNEAGDLWVRGSITQGALIESNLQSPDEIEAERIERFSEGDVLCWVVDRLELCAKQGDVLVQAVADKNGKPIVLGAEVIKVLGPVQTGDLLVASDIPGYAMVDNNPQPGTVIAQALEAFEGERGIIKAMIRKF